MPSMKFQSLSFSALLLFASLAVLPSALAENNPPTASSQFPDLASLPDETEKFQAQIDESDGALLLPPGPHRITATLVFDLGREHSALVRPESGPATLIMDGPGPALRIVGSHGGSAAPGTFHPATWHERMPLVEGIEIIGNHPEADGIELVGTVQSTITRTAVRWCRHGIRLAERNRNVIVSGVHLYENQGTGLYLDDVNLHQINVSASHISYNRGGGIVVRDGNVRNLQITGCDIEANMPGDDSATGTANILIDVSSSPDDRGKSIAEITIADCTIQHSSNYGGKKYESLAPGGANIRILGKEAHPVDSVTISGNIVSDTSLHVDLADVTDITLTGNAFFAPNPDMLRVVRGQRVVVNGNTFNPRQFERPGRIRFVESRDCVVTGNTFRALQAPDGAIGLENCERMLLTGNILADCESGVKVKNSREITVKDWIVGGLPEGAVFVMEEGKVQGLVRE